MYKKNTKINLNPDRLLFPVPYICTIYENKEKYSSWGIEYYIYILVQWKKIIYIDFVDFILSNNNMYFKGASKNTINLLKITDAKNHKTINFSLFFCFYFPFHKFI